MKELAAWGCMILGASLIVFSLSLPVINGPLVLIGLCLVGGASAHFKP